MTDNTIHCLHRETLKRVSIEIPYFSFETRLIFFSFTMVAIDCIDRECMA